MMNEITLQLRFAEQSQRKECARFVPGGNPREWLDELVTWDIPLDLVRLCPLPRSRRDNTCAGVLVTFAVNQAPRCSGWTQSYGQIAPRFYLPVEATLSFEPTAKEWQSLLSRETAAYVWHPHLGLVAFEAKEILSVADLLERPQIEWDD